MSPIFWLFPGSPVASDHRVDSALGNSQSQMKLARLLPLLSIPGISMIRVRLATPPAPALLSLLGSHLINGQPLFHLPFLDDLFSIRMARYQIAAGRFTRDIVTKVIVEIGEKLSFSLKQTRDRHFLHYFKDKGFFSVKIPSSLKILGVVILASQVVAVAIPAALDILGATKIELSIDEVSDSINTAGFHARILSSLETSV